MRVDHTTKEKGNRGQRLEHTLIVGCPKEGKYYLVYRRKVPRVNIIKLTPLTDILFTNLDMNKWDSAKVILILFLTPMCMVWLWVRVLEKERGSLQGQF